MTTNLEPYTDGRGVTVELESHLPVSECCWCHTVMVRREKIESSPRLFRLYQGGYIGCRTGESDTGRPYCLACWHTLGSAEAIMPLRLFGRRMNNEQTVADQWRENAVRVLEEGSN